MKTSLKRSTKTYSTRSAHNDRSDYDTYSPHNAYSTFCLFPPLVLNPSILLVVSLNQNHRCESSRGEVLALITMQKSQKVIKET